MGRDVSTETLNFNVPVARASALAVGVGPFASGKDLGKGDYDAEYAAPSAGVDEREREGKRGGERKRVTRERKKGMEGREKGRMNRRRLRVITRCSSRARGIRIK